MEEHATIDIRTRMCLFDASKDSFDRTYSVSCMHAGLTPSGFACHPFPGKGLNRLRTGNGMSGGSEAARGE